jgi:hypothetical protein
MNTMLDARIDVTNTHRAAGFGCETTPLAGSWAVGAFMTSCAPTGTFASPCHACAYDAAAVGAGSAWCRSHHQSEALEQPS